MGANGNITSSSEPDYATYWAEFYIFCYILVPICGVGILINAAALFHLRRKTHRNSSIRVSLISLTVLDALQLLFTLHSAIPFFCDLKETFQSSFCQSFRMFLSLILSKISATVDTAHMWTVVALTAHRYWKISHPFHSQIHDTGLRAKAILGLLTLSSVLFRIPMYCEVHFYFHGSFLSARERDFSKTTTYNVIYYLILNTIFYNILPFLALTVLNALILRSLLIARRGIRKDCREMHREIRAAAAICAVVTLFLLFHSLFIYDVVKKYKLWILDIRTGVDRHERLIGSANIVLGAVSSTLNPLIYIALGTGCRFCHRKLWRLSGSSRERKREDMATGRTRFQEAALDTEEGSPTERLRLMVTPKAEQPDSLCQDYEFLNFQ